MSTVNAANGNPALKALNGLRVLDLSHGVAGPFAARLLGDLGADVIKVEEPVRGDLARQEEPLKPGAAEPEQSLLFQYLNWNKRGVTLDLRNEASHAALRNLVEQSDIVIEAFCPGTLDRWELAWNVCTNGTRISSSPRSPTLGRQARMRATVPRTSPCMRWAGSCRLAGASTAIR
jgi:crotonobetainyl-CoA:carnitine CoA-transferase CaiB-like acyl-CoA transferase